jgi:hypothetical protein
LIPRAVIATPSSQAPSGDLRSNRVSIAILPVAIAFVVGFAVSEVWRAHQRSVTSDGARIYTLYMGRGDTDVRVHAATFDSDEKEPDANLNKCQRIQQILQDRSSIGLVFWCERGRYHN